MKPKLYVGLDPGQSGGVSWLWQGKIYYEPMPATERDIWNLIGWKIPGISNDTYACIEWINPAIPKISKSTMSKLYGSYMRLRAFLIAAEIPFEEVKPKDWQNSFGISPKGKAETTYRWKCRLSSKAQELYPKLELWDLAKQKQLEVADAILIATFYQRKMEGKL